MLCVKTMLILFSIILQKPAVLLIENGTYKELHYNPFIVMMLAHYINNKGRFLLCPFLCHFIASLPENDY